MTKYTIRHERNYAEVVYMDYLTFAASELMTGDYIEGCRWWFARGPHSYPPRDPCAFAGAKTIDGGGSIYLARAGVVPEARGQGLQRRLIQVRLRWGRSIGATSAITYTLANNLASTNNLIRCGFVRYDPENPWVTTDGVEFWRREL